MKQGPQTGSPGAGAAPNARRAGLGRASRVARPRCSGPLTRKPAPWNARSPIMPIAAWRARPFRCPPPADPRPPARARLSVLFPGEELQRGLHPYRQRHARQEQKLRLFVCLLFCLFLGESLHGCWSPGKVLRDAACTHQPQQQKPLQLPPPQAGRIQLPTAAPTALRHANSQRWLFATAPACRAGLTLPIASRPRSKNSITPSTVNSKPKVARPRPISARDAGSRARGAGGGGRRAAERRRALRALPLRARRAAPLQAPSPTEPPAHRSPLTSLVIQPTGDHHGAAARCPG